jgi:hypothetical protein
MNKRIKIWAALAALACGAAAIAATVEGYQDWQISGTWPPVTPGSGYWRTRADSGSGLIRCIQPSGAACFFSGASGLTLQHNGTPNGSQTLLNLQAGTNIALTDNGSGGILIDAAALGLLLKTNGTNNGSQTLLNLHAGTGMTLTDNGTGQVTFDSSGGLTLQTNGTPNGSQTLQNLAAGANMTLTDNGSGTVTLAAANSATTMRAVGMSFGYTGGSALASGATQFVTIPFGCTARQWDMSIDTGTATIDIWKVASGPADWALTSGTVNTAGTAVTWVSGSTFPTDAAGLRITINSVVYTIASVSSSTALVLTSSASVQSGVAFAGPGISVPTISNTITGGAYPAISTGTAKGNSSLSGWVTDWVKNDILGFQIRAIAGGATALSITVECQQ